MLRMLWCEAERNWLKLVRGVIEEEDEAILEGLIHKIKLLLKEEERRLKELERACSL